MYINTTDSKQHKHKHTHEHERASRLSPHPHPPTPPISASIVLPLFAGALLVRIVFDVEHALGDVVGYGLSERRGVDAFDNLHLVTYKNKIKRGR